MEALLWRPPYPRPCFFDLMGHWPIKSIFNIYPWMQMIILIFFNLLKFFPILSKTTLFFPISKALAPFPKYPETALAINSYAVIFMHMHFCNLAIPAYEMMFVCPSVCQKSTFWLTFALSFGISFAIRAYCLQRFLVQVEQSVSVVLKWGLFFSVHLSVC